MNEISAQEYYSKPGLMTDVNKYQDNLKDLPVDIGGFCEMVQGVLIHYQTGKLYGVELPPSRLDEVRTRFVSRILDNIISLNGAPFHIARPPLERHIGCCRDYATLFCSLLRLQGIAARVRVGFASYLEANSDFYFDHWMTEYWDQLKKKWVRVDPQQDATIRKYNHLSFNPLDIPEKAFVLAGEAWLACRRGEQSSSEYGFEPGESGMWIIRNNLLQDFACLNKMEMTPWDSWGLSDQAYSELKEEQLQKLDEVAELTLTDEKFKEIRDLYETDEEIKVLGKVTSYTINDERTEAVIYE